MSNNAYPVNIRYDVKVAREPDSRARHALRDGVRRALAGGRRHIVVDCKTIDLNFRLLSVLIQCARECQDGGADFEIANLPSRVRASIEALRLDARLGLRQ